MTIIEQCLVSVIFINNHQNYTLLHHSHDGSGGDSDQNGINSELTSYKL